MPRQQTKAELLAENNRLHYENAALFATVIDLVRKPERVQWICESGGGISIAWGLLRLTGPQGGIVVRHVGGQQNSVSVHYLDDLIPQVEHARRCAYNAEIEIREHADNECRLAGRAAQLRKQALEAERGK